MSEWFLANNDRLLDISFWFSVVLSAGLGALSLMAVGKHLSELLYQREKRLNGIRWIQTWINLRIHSNRVAFATAFAITSIFGLFDVDYLTRMWLGRVLFIGILTIYLVSAIMDWIAEARQLRILMKYEEVNNVAVMRMNLHSLSSKLMELYGHTKPVDSIVAKEEVDRLQVEIRGLILGVQHDLHDMDPTFKPNVTVKEP